MRFLWHLISRDISFTQVINIIYAFFCEIYSGASSQSVHDAPLISKDNTDTAQCRMLYVSQVSLMMHFIKEATLLLTIHFSF